MLLTVADFRAQVSDPRCLDRLVEALQSLTGRCGTEEERAWRESLPIVAESLDVHHFGGMHLYFCGEGDLAVEYRLPNSPKWCDLVLLGAASGAPSAVLIELKHWDTRGDAAGRYSGLVTRHYGETVHPSDQVKGYVEYCRAFHSTVQERDAQLHGCVLFTTTAGLAEYRRFPNAELAGEFPLFSMRPGEIRHLPAFLSERLETPCPEFAKRFAQGRYRQPRSLCIQVGRQLADEKSSPFVLLDEQRTAFSVSMAEVVEAMETGRKRVVVVQGPPGSGKSVVAARIWAQLAQEYGGEDRSVTMVTTSASQHSNWRALFRQAAGSRAAEGFMLKANEFIPFTTTDQARARRQMGAVWRDSGEWETNLKVAEACNLGAGRLKADEVGVAIVDEAHALINPESSFGRGQFGFPVIAGPQAYHIIRVAKVSIFLLDSAQSFRERETTSVADIERFASMHGAEVTHVDLSDSQFRCGGSAEYTQWVEGLLSNMDSPNLSSLANTWWVSRDRDGRRIADSEIRKRRMGKRTRGSAVASGLEFELFDSPFAMEGALRERIAEGYSARLLSSYSVRWKTRNIPNPGLLPPADQDFCFQGCHDGEVRLWARSWNVVPQGSDYAPFVQAAPGSGIHEDQLAEVGCPYVVRGFDFDYVGLLWLEDLIWEPHAGEWTVNLESVHESGVSRLKSQARLDQGARSELLLRIAQAYRILLTRPMRGVYLWVPGGSTRTRIEAALGRNA